LSSANMQATMGTNHPPGPSGSSCRSPARDANNGSGRRGRSDNGRSEDPDGSFIPQHLCCRTSSKDSVIIEKFRGKRGEDVERFLRAVRRRMNRNLEANKYYTDEEQNADHVALIHKNCGSRFREYIRSLKGNWEEELDRVEKALKCLYRTIEASALNTGRDKIASLHQRLDESLYRYIQQAQKLTGVCEGCEDMHEDLTERFCHGLRDKGHRNLLAAMEDMYSKPGRIRFETCIANAYHIARSDISYRESQLLTDSDSDSDLEFSAYASPDSYLSEDDRRSRRKRKGKERRRRWD